MKAIVTGSGGFIGRALARRLRDIGIDVICVDRTDGIEAGDYFMNANISDVSLVFHLAAQTSVFNVNKSDIMHDNMEVFRIVSDVCRANCKPMIYASSSTADDRNVTSLYGISKRFNEEYARCYNPLATGVRFHNVYGPNPRHGTLLWYLLNQEHVKLYNGGRNVRHFTYIDDIVSGLTSINPYACDKIVNIANPEEITTLHLAEIVRKYKPVEIELVEEIRDFDRKGQSVNEAVYTVPLQYTSVAEGIKRIFDHEGEK